MRYLFLFIFLTTNAFSQNYHYSVDKGTGKTNLDTTAPSSPTNLVADNITQNSATLNWTASTDDVGVVDYRVYNNNDLFLQSTGGPVTTFTLTNLKLATNYSLTIRAVDAAGNESTDSNNQSFLTQENSIVRFIAIGASIIRNVFYYENQVESLIMSSYPNEVVKVHNEGVNGGTSRAIATRIDSILSKYSTGTKTYVLIHMGGNNVTNSRPFSSTTSKYREDMKNDIIYVLDAIEAKGFIPILSELSFRNYDSTTHSNEALGALPYNESIIKPLILERTPNFAYSDGTSYYQPYNLLYNNYQTYLSTDNIHPSGAGITALKNHFVSTICKYIFEGTVPTKLEKNIPNQLGKNMYEEDDYLNAHFYPVAGSSAAGLQNALDTYGSVRLEAGTYGSNSQTITMKSNNKLYGVPFNTNIPGIIIAAGSTGVIIDGIRATGGISFEPGAPIRQNVIKNINYTNLATTGGNIEDNMFINIIGQMNWNNSASGYFKNNTIIRQWIHGNSPQNVFKGNTSTPSYGNLQIWLNNLTPAGYGNDYDTIEDVTIIGLDSEGWNLSSGSDKAMTYMRNVGNVTITDFGGGNGYSPLKTPPFDIKASNLYLFNSNLNNSDSNNKSKVRANTNVFIMNGKSLYDVETGVLNFNLTRSNTATFNTTALRSTVSDPSILTGMKRFILRDKKTPISRPNLESIPNPAGVNWANDRIGKADQRDYIQGLIDSNKIAELPEGVYYIGSSLKLKGQDQGIRGAGTGKTVIVGLTDDFPLITYEDIGTYRRWYVSNLTLQGGHTGFMIKSSVSNTQMMVSGVAMHDVIFRNQTYGIHLNRFFGLDNNFFENINFVNCNIGLFQDADPNYTGGGSNTMMYMDKNVFYKVQAINCNIGFSMLAKRANNLNSWVDCVFDGNGIAVDLASNSYPNFVNCDFKNHKGDYVIGRSPSISLYSCEFSNNTTTSIFKTTQLNMEGCTLSDNVPVLAPVGNNPVAAYIQNSVITGSLGYYKDGIISNSTMKSNANLNKLLVHIIDGNATTIINDQPNPYPQYLVRY